MIDSPRTAVIVVAAGSGTRLGASVPKAFVELDGREILARCLDGVFGVQESAQVIVVVPNGWAERAEAIGREVAGAASMYFSVVTGGAERQDSVMRGLEALAPSIETVLVHDAARALTPPAQIERVAHAVGQSGGGVVPGIPVADTLKRVDADEVRETVDRQALRAVQTPQGFPRHELERAYQAVAQVHTDDAAVFSAAGGRVTVVDGDESAFKITTPWDLRRAERMLRSATPATRTGIGIDAHAIDPSAELWLAGLHWPGEAGLAGHSDGDAVSHAITDALLSAAGLGDIGGLFGTADEAYAGAHGDVFLAETRRRIERAGWRVANVSVQVIGNRPKLSPRRAEAERVLTDLLGAPVSIAATTTDGLGFTGRGEGISVIATALLTATSHSDDH